MPVPIEIIDRGRGPQLSTTRITVLDLVPYFQQGCSHAEIARSIPTLSCAEAAVAEAYYRAHREEFDERDRRAREWRERQILEQRRRLSPPPATREESRRRLRQLFEAHRERKSAGHSG
ncbi:MAG: DUF433 domain-containing protein [Planctomycetaceae bacterium]